jgi:glucokinase
MFKEKITEILDSNNITIQNVAAIGVSCGGPLDHEKGIVLCPPNLPGWVDIHITEMLTSEYGVPSFLENDAKGCALSEWKWGAGRGTKNMLFCTMGTGFGSGIIINGQLYEGAIGMAGEIGHLRLAEDGPIGFGKAGSFEGFCAGSGIANLAKMRVKSWLEEGKEIAFCPTVDDIESLSAKSVAEAADAGDSDAITIFNEVGRMLGKGLSLLIDALNPERIVIGSIFVKSEHLLREKMEQAIEEETINYSRDVCKIVPAELDENHGFYSSLIIAMTGLEQPKKMNAEINPYAMRQLDELVSRYPKLEVCRESILDAFRLIRDSYTNDHKLLICGNGGSAADSEHIAGELMKGYLLKRPISEKMSAAIREIDAEAEPYLSSHLQGALPTIALTGHVALTTAFNNDVAPDMTFAQQLFGYGRKGDCLLGISTSGNSGNVLNAIKIAKALGIHTIGLSGETGGKMKSICDVTICVPEKFTPYVQEFHLPIYHILCSMLEAEFFEQENA